MTNEEYNKLKAMIKECMCQMMKPMSAPEVEEIDVVLIDEPTIKAGLFPGMGHSKPLTALPEEEHIVDEEQPAIVVASTEAESIE